MDADSVEVILTKAGKAVEGLPEHLQSKAFELAVNMLTVGQPLTAPAAQSARVRTEAARRPGPPTGGGDFPDVSDLLRGCKRNPDRYAVFVGDLEAAGEDATAALITERFRTYKQDVPKLPGRDLADLIAKGWIEQIGKGRDATFVLKRKGRDRIAQLASASGAE